MNNNTGLYFWDLLTVAFIVLKLTKVVDWSWWFVLAPLWFPVAIVLILMLIYWKIWRK